MSVLYEEDRVWKALVAEAPDGWPFDADRDDSLTEMRIPVTSSHPRWSYLIAFDRESPVRPTDVEARMLRSFLDEYMNHWYSGSYREHMRRRPLDVDGGANGLVFHKYSDGDWGYRRHSWTRGPFWPGSPARRGHHQSDLGAQALLRVMDHIHTIGDEPMRHWVDWKATHTDVFGGDPESAGAE